MWMSESSRPLRSVSDTHNRVRAHNRGQPPGRALLASGHGTRCARPGVLEVTHSAGSVCHFWRTGRSKL